mmetsp:Transcript_6078/g.7289  ORF Transcript_6078/g.7289 Transcript_6078/m.7289 type:complete len:82 (-) Transcript_6078:783-1028(-)
MEASAGPLTDQKVENRALLNSQDFTSAELMVGCSGHNLDALSLKSAPKRPLSPFIFFSQEARRKLKLEHPKLNAKQIMKRV